MRPPAARNTERNIPDGEERLSQHQGVHAKKVAVQAPYARHSTTISLMAACGLAPQEKGEKMIGIISPGQVFLGFGLFSFSF